MTTYVSGDWEWDENFDAYETAYATVRVADAGNGNVAPVVTRAVVEAIIGRQAMISAFDLAADHIIVDGNGFMIPGDEAMGTADEWLMPDADDLFDLSPLGWCWTEVIDAKVVRRVG